MGPPQILWEKVKKKKVVLLRVGSGLGMEYV